MCYRKEGQTSKQLAQKPSTPIFTRMKNLNDQRQHTKNDAMQEGKKSRHWKEGIYIWRNNDIRHSIKIHSRPGRFKGLADFFMSPGKRTSKDCGLPSFPMSASPSRPCNPFHHDHQIYYSFPLSLAPSLYLEHIPVALEEKGDACWHDLGWKLFVFSGIKGDLVKHYSKDGDGCLCSFATVNAIHLA